MRRPVIGITSYVEDAAWGVWHVKAVLLPHAYVRHVTQAGGIPLVLPPEASREPGILDLVDGLVLAGGADIDPARYGAEAEARTVGLRPDRDAAESAVLGAALERDLPVLGVCRGMELITVHAGGSLHQHLPDVVGHDDHRPEPGVYGEHVVRTAPGSQAERILGPSVDVRSYHHQGVASTGSAVATGWAHDESVEVVELPDRRFALGVLWHPEAGQDPALFQALVSAAAHPPR
jgi:putative glutamine amidotransferase